MRMWGLGVIAAWLAVASPADASRLKDVASFEGVRENQLIGYGLVVGLDRTGDQVIGGQFTIQAMLSMLNKMGINLIIDPIQLLTRNIASVMVTAKLPPFAKPGMGIDVVVSSMANAKSLQGGTLLLTPLKAPNQQVYAVAQGPVSIGGFLGGASGSTVVKNHQAAGLVPGGAIVEKEVTVDVESWDSISILLRQPDFTTALRVSEAVDKVYGGGTSVPVNGGLVKAAVPAAFQGKVVTYLAALEALDVTVDVSAKVVVNERTGTVVLGEHVRLSTVAIAHGNLTISVKTNQNVSQPNAPLVVGGVGAVPVPGQGGGGPTLTPTPGGSQGAPVVGGGSGGQTVVTEDVQTVVEEEKTRLLVVEETVTLGEVVKALNAVGVTPRDLVAILSALKAAGALQATLEII
ncbi:MAG: flagellar basal body P-ring protein FlgI [Nitrospira sp.]|nr:MAG: flagellar basal body P-ring protein FlgI [Nitrospira sp.]